MKTFEEIVEHRRSVRFYKDLPIDSEKVKQCIELSTLAPNSSNMQLWQFIQVSNPEMLAKLTKACLDQSAAKTAKEMVVFVVRKDWHQKRAKQNLAFAENQLRMQNHERMQKRIKDAQNYYGKLIPIIYTDFLGILGCIKKSVFTVVGLFRPIYRQVSHADVRVVTQKTVGLAAQTFMLAMSNEGYDTCPMEGFDSRMVKNILDLPSSSEICMIVSCGIRDEEKGLYGDRFRVPFEEVYKRV